MPRLARNPVGRYSLAFVATAFVALELLLAGGQLAGDGWRVLALGFEAATIGGLADWYAVHVLFRPAPAPLAWMPLFARHSDLVVRKRAGLTRTAVDLVRTRWLSPEAITAWLRARSPAAAAAEALADPARRARAVSLAREGLSRALRALDRDELADLALRALRDRLDAASLARPLGRVLEAALAARDHDAGVEAALGALSRELEGDAARARLGTLAGGALAAAAPALGARLGDPATARTLVALARERLPALDPAPPAGRWLAAAVAAREHDGLVEALFAGLEAKVAQDPGLRAEIERAVERTLADYRTRHGVAGFFAERFVDRASAAASVAAGLAGSLAAAREDRGHPLRAEIDRALARAAERLAIGIGPEAEAVRALVAAFARSEELEGAIAALLARARAWLEAELGSLAPPSDAGGASGAPVLGLVDLGALGDLLAREARTVLAAARARADHPLRARLDALLERAALALARGEPRAEEALARLVGRALADERAGDLVRSAVVRATRAALADLSRDDGRASTVLDGFLAGLASDLAGDARRRGRLDARLVGLVEGWVRANHEAIGEIVEGSLDPARLSDRELVLELEDKIGDELQYVRLNGAVIGFLVGLVLGAVRVLGAR